MLLVTVSQPPCRKRAPPAVLALLPEKVLLVTVVTPPSFERAPPLLPALLPEKVLLVTVKLTGKLLKMAPPAVLALLPVNVLLVTVSVPWFSIAPPLPPLAMFPEKVTLVTVRVPPWLKTAPPTSALKPLLMVRAVSARVNPGFTDNTRVLPPPLSVIRLPPSMLVSTAMVFSLVTVIVAGTAPQLKVTVPPPLQVLTGGEPVGAPHPIAVFNAASVQLAASPVPTTPPARAGLGSTVASANITTSRVARSSVTGIK